jgi:hypothetical protein
MSYLGNNPNKGSFFQQKLAGDGSTTSFTLLQSVTDGSQLLVTIGNVIQEEGNGKAYTASGATLTFDSAPTNGDVIVVRYLGRSLDTPTTYATQITFKYVATNGQTAFTGSDANGITLSYTIGSVDVYLNGVHLDTTDFTETNESTITLASGATTSDEVVIVAKRTITLADVVPKSAGGTFAGNVIAGGNLTVNGAFTSQGIDDNANAIAITIDSDEDITITKQGTNTTDLRFANSTNDFGGNIKYDHNSGIMKFDVHNSERMRIDASGNLGIGTTPTAKLSLPAQASGDSGVARFAIESAVDSNDFTIAQYEDSNGTYTQIGQNVSLNSGGSTTVLDSGHKTASMFFDGRGNGALMFHTGGTNANSERMRIDSSGNVIIGETSQINGGNLNLATSASDAVLSFLCRSTTDSHHPKIIMQKSSTNSGNFASTADGELLGSIIFRGVNTSSVSDIGAQIIAVQNGTSSSTVPTDLVFNTTENERMRITDGGNVIVHSDLCVGTSTADGKITVSGSTNPLVRFTHTQNANEKLLILTHTYASGSQEATMIEFRDSGGTIRGSIKTSSFGTSYATSSDYRLKESITYDFDATTRLKQLKPCRFNFIGVADNTVDGFLAHEVSSIVPEAIIGDKDAMTEEVLYVDGDEIPDGKKIGDVKEASVIDPQGIDQSKIVPLLTKAFQEALARIDTLEAEVKALKG